MISLEKSKCAKMMIDDSQPSLSTSTIAVALKERTAGFGGLVSAERIIDSMNTGCDVWFDISLLQEN